MDADYVMEAGEKETTKEFVIKTGLSSERWVRAVDLLPGAPQIVRNAMISLDNGTVLAVWVPGDNLVSSPTGTGFRLPAGSTLRLQIHYKKQWQNDGKTIKDRSTIGLYFITTPVPREIQSLTVAHTSPGADAATFGGEFPDKARVVAVRPSLDRVYGALTVQAVTPAGAKIPVLKLRMPRPEWRRRYWLAEPVELPAGSRIEVTTTSPPSFIDLSDAKFEKTYALEVALDVIGSGR
jgi:hypothetical protein